MAYQSLVSPFVAHVHAYPSTMVHGGSWARPVFTLPYVASSQATFAPWQLQGSDGIFRCPDSDGGGVFNQNLAGSDMAATAVKLGVFAASVAAGYFIYQKLLAK